ncbi:GAF domain-containing protein [Mucilaginibacter gossypii]|uniref:Uncharacterized protein n=1 Tax=Mucilaginibacter gossypii TaxID=551996 RepID=A0A1G8NM66_9SPHI|nr:GAF domain-containing protein [Mucilaginibacter gossypii]SDI81288.1 hypothetical protein SAMN05192573_13425 [Mucilaginibacter gossypii]
MGLNGLRYVSRDVGFCSVAILNLEPLPVDDTLRNELFANLPYVRDLLKIRSCAGAPIITPDSYIIDTGPRTMNEKEQRLLKKLARIAMEQTELREHTVLLLKPELIVDGNFPTFVLFMVPDELNLTLDLGAILLLHYLFQHSIAAIPKESAIAEVVMPKLN